MAGDEVLARSRPPVSVVDLSRDEIASWLRARLEGRVRHAFLFGSVATQTAQPWSDVDLVLITDTATKPFVERPKEFMDLFDLGVGLDILVYTVAEYDALGRGGNAFHRDIERSKFVVF